MAPKSRTDLLDSGTSQLEGWRQKVVDRFDRFGNWKVKEGENIFFFFLFFKGFFFFKDGGRVKRFQRGENPIQTRELSRNRHVCGA